MGIVLSIEACFSWVGKEADGIESRFTTVKSLHTMDNG
jgi:hypothetical protein